MTPGPTHTQLWRTVDSKGEKLRYQMLTLPADSPVEVISGQTDFQMLTLLHHLTAKHILPKSRYDSAVLYCAHPQQGVPNGGIVDENLTVYNPNAFIRHRLEAIARIHPLGLGAPEAQAVIKPLAEGQRAMTIGRLGRNTAVIPVHPGMTMLSRHYRPQRATLNAHFFLMESADIPTPWDAMGEPFGLLVINGAVVQPPLYTREALMRRRGSRGRNDDVSIVNMGIRDAVVHLDGKELRHGENARFYLRPELEITPEEDATDLVVVNKRLTARRFGGITPIPAAGFVCRIPGRYEPQSATVDYSLPGSPDFGIQTGPALMENGAVKTDFSTPYYDGRGTGYPPTAYPLDWQHARAARTGIGYKDNHLTLICIEGSKPHVYAPGRDSTGASLMEFAEVCREKGIRNLINLDGGGSAQMSINGIRELKMSDRGSRGEDFERPISVGLGFALA